MNGRNPHPPPTLPPPPRRPPRLVKIVRDRVEQFVGDCRVQYRQVSSDVLVKGLRKKLIEESVEYLEDPCLAEAADVYEALCALAEHDLGASMEDVIEEARAKREERGGFNGSALFIVTTPESSRHG